MYFAMYFVVLLEIINFKRIFYILLLEISICNVFCKHEKCMQTQAIHFFPELGFFQRTVEDPTTTSHLVIIEPLLVINAIVSYSKYLSLC